MEAGRTIHNSLRWRTEIQSMRVPVLVHHAVLLVLIHSATWPVLGQVSGFRLARLTPQYGDLFDAGRTRFLKIEDIASGLGPSYNATSCGGCHNQPSIGGVGNVTVIRAGVVENGGYEVPQGGDLVHLFSIGDYSCQPQIPANANILSHRIPTPLFGAGLVEAIPDSVIRTWEDPADRNGDGIRGHAALVMDPVTHTMRVGRFGWKAQQATLLAFAGEAFRDEMGITNDLFPKEAATGLSAEQLAACDKVPDPEDRPDPKTHLRGIDQVTNFMRFLAPVEPLPLTENRRKGMVL